MKRLSSRLVLAGLLLVLAGCAEGESPVVEGPPPTPTPAVGSAGEDGRHFGYIASVDLDASTIDFEQALFLSGEEANEAAREDGYIDEDDTVPNDYYIRGLDVGEQTLPLAADVQVVIVDWADCCETKPGELEPFAAGFQDDADRTGEYRGSTSPYWITVTDGEVVVIEEQYLP